MRRRIEGIEMKVQIRWLDRVRDDIKEKGLSANEVHDHATCRRRGTCIYKTNPPNSGIVQRTIYNYNGRLNDHNGFSIQLMLSGIFFNIVLLILVKLLNNFWFFFTNGPSWENCS